MSFLQTLIDVAAGLIDPAAFRHDEPNTERVAAIRAAISQARTAERPLDVAELANVEREALAEFEQLRSAGAHSPEQLAALGAVVDVVDAIRAESAALTAASAAVDAFAGRMAPPEPEPEGGDGDGQGGGGGDGGTAATSEPPAADDGTTAPEGQVQAGTQAPAPASAPAPAQARAGQPGTAVVQAARRTPATANPRVPLGALPNDDKANQRGGFTLTAAADIPGIPMGQMLGGRADLTRAVTGRMYALDRAGTDTTAGIATIEIHQPDERLIARGNDDIQAIEYACDETRLEGGSLVAAANADTGGGWCAAPQVVYDEFCAVQEVYGIVELPSVTAPRGSLAWQQSPDFGALYSGTGFYMPIEEMNKPGPADGAAGRRRPKPCYFLDCVGTDTIVTEPYGLCVKSPILMERAYPELVENTMARILVAHAHKMNAVRLAKMAALVPANRQVNVGPVGVDAAARRHFGPGATATLLGLVELIVEYQRNHYRLGPDATMELVLPLFARAIMRADLSKQNGMGLEKLDVQNAALDGYLRLRGVNPQWVVDWQDAFAGTPDMTPNGTWLPTYQKDAALTPAQIADPAVARIWGGENPPIVWPEDVQMLIYPAGTYFQATTDIISIDGMYDSALLAQNLHLGLFTEEAMNIKLRGCYDPILLNVPLCATGETGGQATVDMPELACPAA